MAKDHFENGSWYSTPKKNRPTWLLADAVPLINLLVNRLKPRGWGVALYGSVLYNGKGQNLDLMLCPAHPDAMDMYDLLNYIPTVGLSPVRLPGYGHRRSLGVVSWSWEDKEERLVDMAFWPIVPVDPWRYIQTARPEPAVGRDLEATPAPKRTGGN